MICELLSAFSGVIFSKKKLKNLERAPWERQRELRRKSRKIIGGRDLQEVSREELPMAGGKRTTSCLLPSAPPLFTVAFEGSRRDSRSSLGKKSIPFPVTLLPSQKYRQSSVGTSRTNHQPYLGESGLHQR